MKISSISDAEIERARLVLENHTVTPLTREGAFESGLFCICSQATSWEIPSAFVRNLRMQSHPGDPNAVNRYSTMAVLTDKDRVNTAAEEEGWRFAYAKRFDPFIEYFGRREGEWWLNVRNADLDAQTKYVREVRYLGRKTLDFWMLCLGRDSIALDVHVMKRLSGLGINVPEDFITPRTRSVGKQKVRRTPNATEYARIGSEARTLFSQDERFVPNGHVDMALVDALLWWDGANRGDSNQGYLFSGDRSGLILPYAESEKHN